MMPHVVNRNGTTVLTYRIESGQVHWVHEQKPRDGRRRAVTNHYTDAEMRELVALFNGQVAEVDAVLTALAGVKRERDQAAGIVDGAIRELSAGDGR